MYLLIQAMQRNLLLVLICNIISSQCIRLFKMFTHINQILFFSFLSSSFLAINYQYIFFSFFTTPFRSTLVTPCTFTIFTYDFPCSSSFSTDKRHTSWVLSLSPPACVQQRHYPLILCSSVFVYNKALLPKKKKNLLLLLFDLQLVYRIEVALSLINYEQIVLRYFHDFDSNVLEYFNKYINLTFHKTTDLSITLQHQNNEFDQNLQLNKSNLVH